MVTILIGQILSNAIKYSSGSREKIKVKACKEGNTVILEIADNGVGIPKQDLPRVFKPLQEKTVEILKNQQEWGYISYMKLRSN